MILHIKVKPNSKQNQLIVKDNEISCRIKSPPVDGKANEQLIRFLSEIFDIPKSRVHLLKGQGSVFKKVQLDADETLINRTLESLKQP